MPPEVAVLIERARDLAALVSALTRTCGLTVVQGEAGIGKSHLVRTALADPSISRRRLLVGHARPGSAVYPLGPVVEALAAAELEPPPRLSPLAGALRAVLPDRADLLPPATPPLADPQLARHRLLRATAELLGSVGPAILVLEDAQWADDATIDLLGMVAGQPPDLAILVTYREYDVPAGGRLPVVLASAPAVVRIDLRPLSTLGTARLAAQALGGDTEAATPELAKLLQERGGGVPGLTRHDCRLLHSRRLVRLSDAGWALADPVDTPAPGRPDTRRSSVPDALATLVPSAVSRHVADRTDRLSESARTVLDALAVLTEPGDPELLSAVTGLDEDTVAAAAVELTRGGLLVEATPQQGVLSFRYELARHAAYRALPGTQRRRVHAAAARAIAARGGADVAAQCAEHHRRSGDLAAWATAAEAAAQEATERGDPGAAYRQLRDVLEAGAVPEVRRTPVGIALGWAALACGAPSSELAEVWHTAPRRGRDTAGQYEELQLLRTWILLEEGDPETSATAAPVIEAALRGLTSAQRPDLETIGYALLACPTRVPGLGLREHERFLDTARARSQHTTDPVAHAAVRSATVACLMASGDPGGWRAVERLGTPSEVRVGVQVVRGLLYAADAALYLGHHPRARELAERGLRLAGELRLAGYETDLWAVLLRARWTLGDGAVDQDVRQLVDQPRARARLHGWLLDGMALTAAGQLDRARELLRTTVDRACQLGELSVAAFAVAELSRATPDPELAVDRTTAWVVEALGSERAWVLAAPLLPFASLDVVTDLLQECRARYSTVDVPLVGAAVCYAEARLAEAAGDPATAAGRYAAARCRYATLPDPRMVAHAATAEVRCRLDAGAHPAPTPADGAELLREAWRTFTRLDAAWDADRVKQVFRRAGLPAPHRRGRPGYGNQLSPREREIAELAGQGLTNRDIAARLFLSERTVKYHVANAMRKLEVTSRRQLSAVLRASDDRVPHGAGGTTAPSDHLCRCVRCGRLLAGN